MSIVRRLTIGFGLLAIAGSVLVPPWRYQRVSVVLVQRFGGSENDFRAPRGETRPDSVVTPVLAYAPLWLPPHESWRHSTTDDTNGLRETVIRTYTGHSTLPRVAWDLLLFEWTVVIAATAAYIRLLRLRAPHARIRWRVPQLGRDREFGFGSETE